MNSGQRLKIRPPGRRIDVGGYNLHAHAMGAGQPTVVLEPALGSFALQWMHIQSAVAEFTRVVAYDRAGQGWSDPSPHPRTPRQLVEELHTLLARLQEPPPYILAAHSFGGLVIRKYAELYRDEVAGMVLVDSSHVEQYSDIPNFGKLRRQMSVALRVLTLLSRLGLGGVIAHRSLSRMRPHVSPEVWQQLITLSRRAQHHQTVLAEVGEFDRYFGDASEISSTLGDIPLRVVTAGNSLLEQRPIAGLTAQQLNAAHQARQKQLSQLSSRGEHVIVPKATHLSIMFNQEHASAVVEAIRNLVSSTRESSGRAH
jgi:pimeloyl-ACP methyl ester carboxylesterase